MKQGARVKLKQGAGLSVNFARRTDVLPPRTHVPVPVTLSEFFLKAEESNAPLLDLILQLSEPMCCSLLAVLSAISGLSVGSPAITKSMIVGITCGILVSRVVLSEDSQTAARRKRVCCVCSGMARIRLLYVNL